MPFIESYNDPTFLKENVLLKFQIIELITKVRCICRQIYILLSTNLENFLIGTPYSQGFSLRNNKYKFLSVHHLRNHTIF